MHGGNMHGRSRVTPAARAVSSVMGLVAVVGIAACSDDDTVTPAATATSSVATTTIVVTTSEAPSTTATSATSATTVAPVTTVEDTTTIASTAPPTTDPTDPDPATLEAEVAAAYDDIYEGYWACLRAPLECDTSWLVPGSGSAEAMQATMQGLADRDRFVGDDPVGYYVIESIEFDDTLTEATVTTCWWSTAVLYTTPADPTRPPGPDNPPTVVNDRPGSSRQVDVVVAESDSWIISTSTTSESIAGVNQCES